MNEDMNVYKEWAEKSGELWKERCRKFLGEEYNTLLRVARAAHAVCNPPVGVPVQEAHWRGEQLEEALKEVEDLLK